MDRDTLSAQLLLQFYTDSLETSLVIWSWSENTHRGCKVNGQAISGGRNSSYRFYQFFFFLNFTAVLVMV